MTAEEARRQLEEAMQRDPDIGDVIAAMRSQGKSWIKIFQCFSRYLTRTASPSRLSHSQPATYTAH